MSASISRKISHPSQWATRALKSMDELGRRIDALGFYEGCGFHYAKVGRWHKSLATLRCMVKDPFDVKDPMTFVHRLGVEITVTGLWRDLIKEEKSSAEWQAQNKGWHRASDKPRRDMCFPVDPTLPVRCSWCAYDLEPTECGFRCPRCEELDELSRRRAVEYNREQERLNEVLQDGNNQKPETSVERSA